MDRIALRWLFPLVLILVLVAAGWQAWAMGDKPPKDDQAEPTPTPTPTPDPYIVIRTPAPDFVTAKKELEIVWQVVDLKTAAVDQLKVTFDGHEIESTGAGGVSEAPISSVVSYDKQGKHKFAVWARFSTGKKFKVERQFTYQDPTPGGMVLIPSSAEMRRFYMDVTEVTNRAYRKCVDAGKCKPSAFVKDGHYNGANMPVVGVSYDDAQNYCRWKGYRLPDADQWTYAARGSRSVDRYGDPNEIAWHSENSGGKPHAVKGKAPNAYGLYDMLGNVWEWCEAGSKDAVRPDQKIIRGGSWGSIEERIDASRPMTVDGQWRVNFIGFRCSKDWVDLP